MKSFTLLVLIVMLSACGGKQPSEEEYLEKLDEQPATETTVDTETINAILQQIPSPLEISMMLKESGTSYDAALLNSTDNISKYNTNSQKALNLGVYGTDLGYTNIYGQNQDGLEYMASIKELADGLSIGQFFELETIGKLATNSQNLDSLLLITTQNFNSINSYLQEQGRSNLSVLILVGGWIEAMHITCQVAMRTPENELLMDAIGQQQVVTESLKSLFELYGEDPTMSELRTDLEPVWAEFENVEIVTEKGETTQEIVDGVLMIKDNSTSTVVMSEETFENIVNKIAEVRSKVTG